MPSAGAVARAACTAPASETGGGASLRRTKYQAPAAAITPAANSPAVPVMNFLRVLIWVASLLVVCLACDYRLGVREEAQRPPCGVSWAYSVGCRAQHKA